MEFLEKTAFEAKNSNCANDLMQQIAGKYGTYSDSTYTKKDCSAGIVCKRAALIPSEGYESIMINGKPIVNSNTWYMVAADNGNVEGLTGDHTGLYAFDSYDVNKAASGGNTWNIGFNTLGLGLPAGERGTFRELILNEQYHFGVGNFTAEPTVGQYATLADGKWTPSATVPASGKGVYAKVLYQKDFTEGTETPFTGYVMQILRTAPVAG